MQKPTNKMDCSFIRSNLFSYQEKKLSARESVEFEAHLDTCQACSGIVSGFQSVSSLIDSRKSVELNPFTQTRILQRIDSEVDGAKEKTHPLFQRILHPVPVSFLMLIAMIIGFAVVNQQDAGYSDSTSHQNNIQVMKSGLNLPDFIDEDNTFFDEY
jgi:hypothetical protein